VGRRSWGEQLKKEEETTSRWGKGVLCFQFPGTFSKKFTIKRLRKRERGVGESLEKIREQCKRGDCKGSWGSKEEGSDNIKPQRPQSPLPTRQKQKKTETGRLRRESKFKR